MAIHVEDDPLSYSSFEETTPPQQYTNRIAAAIRGSGQHALTVSPSSFPVIN